MKTINTSHIVARMQMVIPALLFLIASCDQYEFRTSSDAALTGTVWKLEGFGSVRAKLDIAKPALEKNYQLLLEPDGKAYGISSVNHLGGEYTLNEEKQTLHINIQVLTSALEMPDGNVYLSRLSKVHRYELSGNILHLYYSDTDFLQYRPAADDSYLREIVSNLTK